MGCKCVYNIKIKSDGSPKRFKVRLVAKGFTQKHGVDYEEIFILVAHMTSIKTLICIALTKKWFIVQMDVKNIFLNENLKELFMEPPPNLDISNSPFKKCSL